MVQHLWMSGVVMAFLSFGIKTGMGMGARIFNPGVSKASAGIFSLGVIVSYLALFSVLHLVVTRLNLIAYLDRLTGLIQYGMLVHLAVAFGLLLWGGWLLMKTVDENRNAGLGAGIFLVLPCPVCATVILLNLTLALSLSEMSPLTTTFSLFGLFWGIIGLTLAGLFLFRGKKGLDNHFLGAAMVLIALYFLTTVLIAPIYPKIKPAFNMALSNNPTEQIDLKATLILTGVSLVLAGLGFVRVYFKKGECS